MLNDLRYAVRTLVRNPGFTTVAVLTLALGIGANTAIFSVVYAVLMRPLPYPRPAELMAVHESLPPRDKQPARSRMAVAPPSLRDWTANSSFTGIAVYASGDDILTGAGEPARIPSAEVTHNFFQVFHAIPVAGRLLTADDDRPDQPRVAVIGHALWQGRFGGDQTVVGKPIDLSGERYTVIGIAQEGFAFPEAAQIWTPLALPASEFADDQRMSFYLAAIGRLKPGVSRHHAAADLNAIAAGLATRLPDVYKGRGVTIVPLHESIVGDVKPALLILLGTVGVVLLIACANVANLLLARSAGREGEIAISVRARCDRRADRAAAPDRKPPARGGGRGRGCPLRIVGRRRHRRTRAGQRAANRSGPDRPMGACVRRGAGRWHGHPVRVLRLP